MNVSYPKRSVGFERLQHGTWNSRMEKFRILSCVDWFILRLPNCSDEQPHVACHSCICGPQEYSNTFNVCFPIRMLDDFWETLL